jgi:hypothetical protein
MDAVTLLKNDHKTVEKLFKSSSSRRPRTTIATPGAAWSTR